MLSIRLQNDKKLIPETAIFLSHVARDWGVTETKTDMLCFLLESALELRMNQLSDDNPYITVEVKEDISSITISITDKGIPYVLTHNQKQTLNKGLADRFKLEQLGSRGQRFTVSFNRVPTEKPEEIKEEIHLLDTDLYCNLTGMSDEEIIEAIRCIYSVYGYDYVHPQIYQIEHFRQKLDSGNYISILCRNKHGQVAGHFALDELDEFPGIMECCNLVVKPYARRLGVAERLMEKTIQESKAGNIKGLFSRPVMQHPASEKLFDKYDFVPCGINFNAAGTDQLKEKEFHDLNSRIHWSFASLMFDRETEHVLYLSDECRQYVADIFDKAQTNYRFSDERGATEDESSITYEITTENKTVDAFINTVGTDIRDRIDDLLDKIKDYPVETISVFLNMNDPGCPDCYDMLRERGYIFTGCLPGSTAGDFVLLQDLKGTPIDEKLLVTTPGYDEMIQKIYAINRKES